MSFNSYKEKEKALSDIEMLKKLSQSKESRSRFIQYENLLMEVVQISGKKVNKIP